MVHMTAVIELHGPDRHTLEEELEAAIELMTIGGVVELVDVKTTARDLEDQ